MQASKTATDGSNAIAPPEVLGVLGQRFHRRPLGVDLCLQRQHVLQLRPAMLSDIPEGKVADVHSMDDERTGDAQDVGCVVWAELLILGKHGDSSALNKMAEGRFEQICGLRGQPYDVLFSRLAPNPDLNLIALANRAQRLGCLAVLVRELDEMQHMGGHGQLLPQPPIIGLGLFNCNI